MLYSSNNPQVRRQPYEIDACVACLNFLTLMLPKEAQQDVRTWFRELACGSLPPGNDRSKGMGNQQRLVRHSSHKFADRHNRSHVFTVMERRDQLNKIARDALKAKSKNPQTTYQSGSSSLLGKIITCASLAYYALL